MNIFYTNAVSIQRMPSTWQSILLRLATFISIAAGSWYTLLKSYSMLGLSQYSGYMEIIGNGQVMFVMTYAVTALLFYFLYTFYVRLAYNSMMRQLFFFDAAMSMYDFRLRVDIAVIALCVFKALISVLYMAYPLYESVIRSVINPLAAACAFGGALYALVLKAGKQNKEAVICSLSIMFCLPLIFA